MAFPKILLICRKALAYPSIATATCKNPSGYDATLPKSSIDALIGTTAPWRTGCASKGFRLLGNSDGSVLFNVVPSVCGCREESCKGTRDCTTRMWPACWASSAIVSSAVGLAEVGRYILIGMCRISTPGGLRSLVFMELNSVKSSERTH